MAQTHVNHRALAISTAAAAWFLFWSLVMMSSVGSAERVLKDKATENFEKEVSHGFLPRMVHFLWQSGKSSYEHVWPVSFQLSSTQS
jgi:hypothetical protein